LSPAQRTDAILVGWERQENLGLRHILSYLEAEGYRVQLVPYAPGAEDSVVRAVCEADARLVGFSIIFQYNLRDYGELMKALRKAGVQSHFTAGGHYPSLRPENTLREIPELDTVVRFEGELTARELLERLDRPETWGEIQGLTFRRNGEVVVNPARPLIEDLDRLPWPARGEQLQSVRGIPTAPMLASRGCLFDCSFCSIRQFYGQAPGPLRRTRSPEDVAREMRYLFDARGVRLFLFQDDDFAAKTENQRDWVGRFLLALDRERLTGRIGWKISCRVDDIEPEIMTRCRDRGLLTVYLGVESGNASGLETLNKHATVEQNLRAMRILKETGVDADMGFMLLDPGSTLESVRENVAFLRKVAELGGPPICFVKTLPLAGTAMEKQLAGEGRLTGDPLRPDYRFLDPRLDHYALWITLRFSQRNSAPNGLVETLRIAHFDQVVARAFEAAPWTGEYGAELRRLIDRANESAISTLERTLEIVDECPDADSVALAWRYLNRISAEDATVQARIFRELDWVLERYSPPLCAAIRQSDPVSA
jgi:anaerobic magnesium-protoporphyrin IX monomethyl ester cyclase